MKDKWQSLLCQIELFSLILSILDFGLFSEKEQKKLMEPFILFKNGIS